MHDCVELHLHCLCNVTCKSGQISKAGGYGQDDVGPVRWSREDQLLFMYLTEAMLKKLR